MNISASRNGFLPPNTLHEDDLDFNFLPNSNDIRSNSNFSAHPPPLASSNLKHHPHHPSPRVLPPAMMLSNTPSPISSGLPSPALPPSHLPRSPVINLNHSLPSGHSSPRPAYSLTPFPFKDDFDYNAASGSMPTSPTSSPSSPASGRSSAMHEDVLASGDLIGEGLMFQGELVVRVSMPPRVRESEFEDEPEPALEFEVVKRLGAGSYAVVYQVREVLERRDLSDDGCFGGRMDGPDGEQSTEKRVYGGEFAVKCLSKANLDEEALEAQMVEANLHQTLPTHPNIVTLHRTLETSSFLLLVLEFVPGEDLFYFLEQARDHYEPDPSSTLSPTSPSGGNILSSPISTSSSFAHALPIGTGNGSTNKSQSSFSSASSRTPPTPSLLSSQSAHQLLSRTRLKLIASMFGQMCEAVAICHDVGVFHRDIKPENFIVTDGWYEGRSPSRTGKERRVVVKLTDFGLSTKEVESCDMDCGSAPYMSYECKNNCAPTYSPRAADVWSLGIVLINMLYHINPWTDTTEGVCSSFSFFRADPDAFFASRFAGMTPAVARFLTDRVFCILDDAMDTKCKRVSARGLGRWVRDLPNLLGQDTPVLPVPLAMALTQVQGQSLSRTASRDRSRAQSRSQSRMQSQSQLRAQAMALSQAASSDASAQSPIVAQLHLQQLLELQQQQREQSQPPPSPAWRHKRGLSNASIGFSLSSVPQSRRPSSRQASFSESATPTAPCSRANTPLLRGRGLPGLGTISMSRAPSTSREPVVVELPTVFDQDGEEDIEVDLDVDRDHEHDQEAHELNVDVNGEVIDDGEGMDSRTPSVVRRRKRGARRGKGQQSQQQQASAQPNPPLSAPPAPVDALETLATASQALARELSRASRSQSSTSHRVVASNPVAIQTPLSVSASIAPLSAHVLRSARAHAHAHSSYAHAHGRSEIPKRSIPGVFDWETNATHHATTSSSSVHSVPASASSSALPTATTVSVNGVSSAQLGSVATSSGSGAVAAASSSNGSSSSTAPPVSAPPVIAKKTSKWKLSFGRSSSNSANRLTAAASTTSTDASTNGATSEVVQGKQQQRRNVSPMASTVTNVVLGLNSTHHKGINTPAPRSKQPVTNGDVSTSVSPPNRSTGDQWPRGRLERISPPGASSSNVNNGSVESWGHGSRYDKRGYNDRNPSPTSVRNGRYPGSSASSIANSSISSNWRNSSISTSSSASSAFTRYSNSSVRSVSTVATSVSAGSWRNQSTSSLSSVNGGKPGSQPSSASLSSRHSDTAKMPPPNVKFMTGVPWALDELPRQLHPNPVGDIFGGPPIRKQRQRKQPKDLPTINERPVQTPKSPLSQRADASFSSTDLRRDSLDEVMSVGSGKDGERGEGGGGGGAPRKVQKGQINALAKMLSAFVR